MAYFHCLISGGSSGGGYTLTVTCDAAFAGTTITCTDGVTTLTSTCPSSSPYVVEFEIPNGGDWTISGVVSGQTVSTGVSFPISATLNATIQQTVTIYSAKEDTISYVDIDGATQTITFASGATSKQVTIEIELEGSSITFTSGVAKDPSNLSNYYSKTVTITDNTTDVYLMPDNALYWYGNECTSLSGGWSGSGYSYNGTNNGDLTKNTNSILMDISSGSSWKWLGVASAVDLTDYDKVSAIGYINNSTLVTSFYATVTSLTGNNYIGFGAQYANNGHWDNVIAVGSSKTMSSSALKWTRDNLQSQSAAHTSAVYVYAVLLETS